MGLDTTDLVRRLRELAECDDPYLYAVDVPLTEAADCIERLAGKAEPPVVDDKWDAIVKQAYEDHPAAPAPDAATLDQIMALADYQMESAAIAGMNSNRVFEARAALRAAVERVIAERDAANTALLQAQEAAKILLARGEMLLAFPQEAQEAQEEVVRVPYGVCMKT